MASEAICAIAVLLPCPNSQQPTDSVQEESSCMVIRAEDSSTLWG